MGAAIQDDATMTDGAKISRRATRTIPSHLPLLSGLAGAIRTALLAALLLLLAPAADGQYILTTGQAVGPDGNAVRPGARPGDKVDFSVWIANYCEFDTAISIHEVSLLVHHGDGSVSVSNLVDEPVFIWQWGDSVVFTTNFAARCADPEVLAIGYTVRGMVHWGRLTGSPMGEFSVQFGSQITIRHDAPPALSITRAAAGGVRVNWPASPCYRLESCDEVSGQWHVVSEIPAQIEGANSLTLSSTGGTRRFFRLAKP